MRKLNKTLIATGFLGILLLPGCNNNQLDKTDSSVKDEKEQVYVLPTDFGKRYLKRGVDSKRAFDLRKNENDGSYHMSIDASAVSETNIKFNLTGTAYQKDDIDVVLFGIGTNFNNTSKADTLLYATLDQNVAAIADDSLEGSLENSSEIEEKNIITGVEYAYGTGPIKNEFDKEQLLWLKTTAMEEKNGTFIASPTADIKFTPVYIELKDTVAPVVSDFGYSISYSDYGNTYRYNLEDSLKKIIKENATYSNSGQIDKDVKPEISYFAVEGGIKENYCAGDMITGEFSLMDNDGNESNRKWFVFHIDKDYAVDKLIDVPYSKTVLFGKSETEDYLRAAVADTMYPDTHSLDETKVSFNGFDSLFSELSNLKENITTEKEFDLNATISGYTYTETSSTFPFKIRLYDDKPITWRDNVKWNNKKYNRMPLSTYKSVSEYVNNLNTGIVSIKDDFEDNYYWLLRRIIIKDDDENTSIDIMTWILDSALIKLAPDIISHKLGDAALVDALCLPVCGKVYPDYSQDRGSINEMISWGDGIEGWEGSVYKLYKLDGTPVAVE